MNDEDAFDIICIWFTDEAHFHLDGYVKWINENGDFRESKTRVYIEHIPCIPQSYRLGISIQ